MKGIKISQMLLDKLSFNTKILHKHDLKINNKNNVLTSSGFVSANHSLSL